MHDEKTTAHSTEHAETLGYEDSDVAIPVLMKWGFSLAVFVGVTSLIVLGVYALLVRQFATRNEPVKLDIARRFPADGVPQLQVDPVKDIKNFRRDEKRHVTGQGVWKDGDGKDANYISIDRAMKIVEAKGLPIQSADASAKDVTPPAVDRGFVDNPLPAEDGGRSDVPGRTGTVNGVSPDDASFQQKLPGM